MWNREEKPAKDLSIPSIPPATPPPPAPAPQPVMGTTVARKIATLGASLVITGELSGAEDLMIEGRIEGKISLPAHLLTIGPQAKVSADVVARAIVIQGSITGNVTATERLEIMAGGSMNGDLVSPKVVMAEGADFCGRVEMRRGKVREQAKEGRFEPVAV